MADTKISALAALTTPAGEDRLPIVDDPAGTPVTKYVTLDTLFANAGFVLPKVEFTTNNADFTGTNGTAVQPIFQAANDRLTVLAATSYYFELAMYVTNGATTCTKALAFDAGTCTFTSIRYAAVAQNAAVNTTGTAQSSAFVDTAAVTVILATGTTAWWIRANGIMRINGGGTLLPQFKFSADPTGAIAVKKDSYMYLFRLGSNTVAFAGGWA